MKKQSKRMSRRIDALIAERLEPLLKEKLASLDIDSLRTQLERISPEKAEALIRAALDALDKHGIEKVWRDVAGTFEEGKLDQLLRENLDKIDADELAKSLRSRANVDWNDVEKQIRARIDSVLRDSLNQVDVDDLVDAVRKQMAGVDLDKITQEAQRSGKRLQRKAQQAMPSEADLRRVAEPLGIAPKPEPKPSFLGSALSGIGSAVLLTSVGWIAYSKLFVDHQVALPKAISSDQMTLRFKPTGPVNVYFDKQVEGRPLVLIHSVNAAASAYEMRPLFQHYRSRRPVFAIDLPGFGFSARPAVDYSAEVFVQAILALLDEFEGDVDIIAHSLSSEFAAEATRRRPNAVNSLTLISPSGMGDETNLNRASRFMLPFLAFPLWARPFFDLLTTRRGINYFLQKSFVGESNPGLADYDYASAHQPGAEHAPLAFVSGRLFTPEALDKIYRGITTPALVLYDLDAFVDFDRLPELLSVNSAWRAERISPTLGLPHWEKLPETLNALDNFWDDID